MKKFFTITIFILLFPILTVAQTVVSFPVKPEGVVERETGSLKPGASVTLAGIGNHYSTGAYAQIIHLEGQEKVELNRINRIKFKARNLEEFWIIKSLQYNVYGNLMKNGYQYNMRDEIDKDVVDYISYLENNDLFIQDSYLEGYLHGLLLKVFPGILPDGRPGNITIRIVKDIQPNASMYSNGALLINSGLLSLIESEEELLAVLAHELAHYVLDHSVININTAIRRQRRAEFWSAVATGVVAATEIYVASRDPYYYPGDLTFATAVLSQAVAELITDRMGMKFSQNQENEADLVAAEVLQFAGLNTQGLSSVLTRLKTHHIQALNFQALHGGQTHPSLDSRITSLGEPGVFEGIGYDARISFINTFNAKQYFIARNYNAAAALATRNIDAGVAVEEDYLVLAAINMALFNTPEKNNEALEFLNMAKTLNIYPLAGLYKQEALVYFRLGFNGDAEESLKLYNERLYEQGMNNGFSKALQREMEWTTKMIAKARFL
jgi:beta-barrel assembly-enhancing protease